MRKYITELSGTGVLPVYREGRGWKLTENASMSIPPVQFKLEEAAAVYLAARLLLRHADEPNPAVRGALTKLAKVIPEDLRLPFSQQVARSGIDHSEHFAEIFAALSFGWALKRVIRITYAARSREETFEADIRPYLLEPCAVGSALYVIGRLDPPGEMRVLKLERIRSAKVTQATFRPPNTGELLDRLDQAWGVWLSDDAPTELTLRFSTRVAERVRETRWHPSQHLETQPDGRLQMTLTVASTVEILPWILGWGAHCEVLSPGPLRKQVAEELAQAAGIYSS
jgi:predicted DNA-binding transcriptional regulator YafY